MNFAFFDLETTGISPAFDHPLQFAAILTDAEFREIERVNLRCRMAPHVIPSPQAIPEMKASSSYDPATFEEIEVFLSGLETVVADGGAIKR